MNADGQQALQPQVVLVPDQPRTPPRPSRELEPYGLIAALVGLTWLFHSIALRYAHAGWLSAIQPVHYLPFACGVYGGIRKRMRVPLVLLAGQIGLGVLLDQHWLLPTLAAFAIGLAAAAVLRHA